MALTAPPEGPQADDLDTLREIISHSVAHSDKKPELSTKERELLDQLIAELEKKHGKEPLDVAIRTPKKRDALRGEVAEAIEKAMQGTSPRTDIADLNATLGGTLRRLGIEKRIKTVAKGDLLKEIETVDDLRHLPVNTLIKLEQAHEGILLYAFTDVANGDTKIDLTNFYFNPQEGAQLRVDFRGNGGAEAIIGAADICPPSVRRITVYERGDENLARTSTRRIGLKGNNQGISGFFDQGGYIPIYTGDVMVIGGVDQAFEKEYRTPEGQLDIQKYTQGAEAVEDQKFIDELRTRGVLSMSKAYTQEELVALQRSIEASGIGAGVVEAALHMVGDRTPGAHCWDWIDKVYTLAGATRRTVYRGSNYVKNLKKDDDGFDRNPRNPSQLRSLASGDWIFTYNRNGVDSRDAHSVLFLGWIDEANLIGRAVSQPRSGAGGRIHRVDFKRTPLVYLMKPVPQRGFERVEQGVV